MNVICSLRIGLVVAAAVFLQHNATAQITPIPYGDADSFAILAHTTITDVPGSSTINNGNVGLYTGTSITGLTPSQVHPFGPPPQFGIYHKAIDDPTDAWLLSASNAASHAYDLADGEAPRSPNLGLQLGGLTLIPGVYTFDPGVVLLDGTLTLNANGDPNPVWIFQATSALTTHEGALGDPLNARVVFLDGVGTPCDVLWQVPSSATIGTYSDFVGTIIAYDSIWLHTDATLHGRAWAENGEVTLDHNTITGLPCTSLGGGEGGGTSVPDSGSTLLLLATGLATLVGLGRRFRSQV